MLASLFGESKSRVLSALVFAREPIHVREVARQSGVAPIQVSRVLNEFLRFGIVSCKRVGNLRVFSLVESPSVKILRGLVEETRGVIPALRDVLRKIKGVKTAFVYGSFASGKEGVKSDVDLIIVGEPDLTLLSWRIMELEARFGKEINYSVFSRKEFEEKKRKPFLSRVLSEKKIVLVGDENEFE